MTTPRRPGAGWVGDPPSESKSKRGFPKNPKNKLEMVEHLRAGKTVVNHREGGNSMTPLIKSRQPCNIVPITRELEKGDIVFVKVHGRFYMHKIIALDGDRVQIGNNHGRINGWTPRTHVYGLVVPQ